MKKKNLNRYKHYNKRKKIDMTPTIHRRYKILIFVVILCFTILTIRLYQVQILKNKYYADEVIELNTNIIEGSSAPRGRIYDRNGNLLVDNVPVKTIVYKKSIGVSAAKEIKMAYQVAEMIAVDYSSMDEKELKNFWILNHEEEANLKITEEEWRQLEERKITNKDILDKKIKRVTETDLESYQEIDYEAAYIYYLMNHGYSFDEKVIKKEGVTDEEYAIIAENLLSLDGFNTHLDWERYYPYGDTFRSVLGNVSSSESGIPAELKDSYLALGYNLNDRIGISYIEAQYETLLRGTKTKYKVANDRSYEVIEEGSRGHDIVLTIDIELQREIEKILEEELLYTKKHDKYTKYLDRAFVVIQDSKTGEVLAMAGKEIKEKDGGYEVTDYSTGVINSVVTPGSSIKAASHIVGYTTGNLKIGEVRNDACIKLAATPLKCSFSTHGNINDLEALKYSSNTYQFHTAIKVGGATYHYNQALKIKDSAFDTYRNIFGQFGLGVKTEIDLPNETEGYQGTSRKAGLLLDFAIGQYDNYTPIQLSQYITTVANKGTRMKPYLLKAVYEPTKEKLTSVVFQNSPTVLNKVDADSIYFDRVQEGLKQVMARGGTGSNYIDNKYHPAGKTGTAQSFVDKDNDGSIDTETLTSILVAYAPYDNPTVTFTVVTPHVSTAVSYAQMSKINNRISQKVSKKYFEIYK